MMPTYQLDQMERIVSVVHLYRLLLQRTADRVGLRHHAERLAAGEGLAQIARSLLQSDEGCRLWAGCTDDAIARQIMQTAGCGRLDATWRQTQDLPQLVAGLARDGTIRAAPLIPLLFPNGVDPGSDDVYPAWGYRLWADESERVLSTMARRLGPLLRLAGPAIGLVLDLSEGDAAHQVAATIESLRRQLHRRWHLLVRGRRPPGLILPSDSRISTASSSRLPAGDWIGWLRPGDTLSASALTLFGAMIRRRPGAPAIYCDEDRHGPDGVRSHPILKTAWDAVAAEQADITGGLTLFKRRRLIRCGGDRPELDPHGRLRRVVQSTPDRRLVHLPAVLCHRPHQPAVAAVGRQARVPSSWPSVSVVIATRDRAALLQRCVDTLRHCTAYPTVEVVVVDNGSTEPDALALLEHLRRDGCKVLSRPGPFNWSALNNDGVRCSSGEIVVLMNNDVACIRPDWLDEMVSACLRPQAGVVGAVLLYEDRTVQHAGVLIGPGPRAAHALASGAFQGAVADAAVQTCAAVTGACMAVRRPVFERLGGLNAEALPVTWNDLDFCLRAREQGLHVLLARRAVLLHAERGTRTPDAARENQPQLIRTRAFVARRHRQALRADPFLNPQLSAASGGRLLLPCKARRFWSILLAGGR